MTTQCESAAEDALAIVRLAKLSRIEYDRCREAEAERLGIRVSTLDKEVDAARGDCAGSARTGQGRPLELPDPDPWPEPVNGATLLNELTKAVRRYIVLGGPEADAVALWVLAVHAFDLWRIFARLIITAPEKGCGKTTLLDLLSRLVPRPLAAANIKAAPLFRVIELARPTLLLDEADAYARYDEDLRSVLDAGHHRDGAVIRCVGDDHEPRQFSAWAPVALAAIGHLPGTIEDRSIIIRLRRRRPDEAVQSLRLDCSGELDNLARKAARWAADNGATLGAADPALPNGIYNRSADNWRPLVAVADIADCGWPKRARRAAIDLSRDGEEAESAQVLLLGDLRELFEAEPSGVLFTEEILAALRKDENRPWPEWKNGKPITDRQVAALVKGFKIRPKTVRREAKTDKGYRCSRCALVARPARDTDRPLGRRPSGVGGGRAARLGRHAERMAQATRPEMAHLAMRRMRCAHRRLVSADEHGWQPSTSRQTRLPIALRRALAWASYTGVHDIGPTSTTF